MENTAAKVSSQDAKSGKPYDYTRSMKAQIFVFVIPKDGNLDSVTIKARTHDAVPARADSPTTLDNSETQSVECKVICEQHRYWQGMPPSTPDEQQGYPQARSDTLVDEEVDDGERRPLVESLDDRELMSAEPASSSSRSRKCSSLLTLIAEERQQREELRANVTASESAEGVDVVETAEFTEKMGNSIPAITTTSMIGILIERFEAEEVIIQDRDACKQAICQVGLRTRNILEECSSSSWTTCKVSAYHLVLVTIHDARDVKKKDTGRGLKNHELETTREADDICIIDFCFGNGSPSNIVDAMRVRTSRCQPLTGDLIIAETLVLHNRVIHRSNRESVEKLKRKELRADVTIRKRILLKRSEDIICKDGTICEQKITSEDNGFKIIEIPFHVIHSDGKGEWNHEA